MEEEKVETETVVIGKEGAVVIDKEGAVLIDKEEEVVKGKEDREEEAVKKTGDRGDTMKTGDKIEQGLLPEIKDLQFA